MTEDNLCWSCNNKIDEGMTTCPNCGMPLEESSSKDDLDFLDDLLATTQQEPESKENSQADEDELDFDFAIPDMDYVEGKKEESASPKGDFVAKESSDIEAVEVSSSSEDEIDLDMDFAIPDMDYVEGKKEESASPKEDVLQIDGTSPEETTLSQDKKDSLLEDMDTLLTSVETSTSELETSKASVDYTEQETSKEELDKISQKGIEIIQKPSPKWYLWLFSSQSIYWTLFFTVVVFGTFRIKNPEFSPTLNNSADFYIHPIALSLSWLGFLVMGWFYSYKLRLNKINPNIIHAILLIIFNFVIITLISQILLLTTGNLQINSLLIAYYAVIPIFYLIGFLTGGWFAFALGFKYAWSKIYQLSPISEIEPSLSEL